LLVFLYFLLICFCKKSTPPLCDFMQWLDTEQSDDDKSTWSQRPVLQERGGSA
jgi:hypothetical protein